MSVSGTLFTWQGQHTGIGSRASTKKHFAHDDASSGEVEAEPSGAPTRLQARNALHIRREGSHVLGSLQTTDKVTRMFRHGVLLILE